MKNTHFLLAAFIIFFSVSCSKTDSESSGLYADAHSAGSSGTSSGSNNQSGLITAGEWNDLDNWTFWKDLMDHDDFKAMPDHWSFYTDNRISIHVKNGSSPVIDAEIKLFKNSDLIWTCRTDNFGSAELWPGLFDGQTLSNLDDYTLSINNFEINEPLQLFDDGEIDIQYIPGMPDPTLMELCFIVDATGSMSDELEFLKDDLEDVISRVEDEYPNINTRTSSVFYRDEGDEYVVKAIDFSDKLNNTLNFIDKQEADGGGDYPEAVHAALEEAIDELQWSYNARTRIAFLLLDAPPHYEEQIIDQLHDSVEKAAALGVKIIPITASGIDKETEFLMRFFAIATNGTYVFISNDSGIGEDHLEASVGEFEVEYLNDLMVRLIAKYLE